MSTLAGLTIQSRLGALSRRARAAHRDPARSSRSPGSLAGILSARVATKLHLGVLDPSRVAVGPIAPDLMLVFLISVPIYLVLGVAADVLAALAGLASPGVLADDRGGDAGRRAGHRADLRHRPTVPRW